MSLADRRWHRRLEAGAANVNDAMINYTVLSCRWGRQGFGPRLASRCGRDSQVLRTAGLVVTGRVALKREPHMYPYRARTSRLIARLFKFLYGRGRRDSPRARTAGSLLLGAARTLRRHWMRRTLRPGSDRARTLRPGSGSSAQPTSSKTPFELRDGGLGARVVTVVIPSFSAGARLKARSST